MNKALVSYRNACTLATFAIIIGSALFIVNSLTAPTIKQNAHLHLKHQLAEVLPNSHFDNDLLQSKIDITDEERNFTRTVYRGFLNDQANAAVISATAQQGYAGPINLLVGVTINEVVTGVRVTEHTETPGLGDDIELRKSNWILSFNGKTTNSTMIWAVQRDGGDYDQFTGATITPRAVVRTVKETLEWFRINKSQVFAQ